MEALAESLRAESRVQSEEQLIAFKQILNPLQVRKPAVDAHA